MYTLQNTINWSQSYVQYIPLTAGTLQEPAISIASMVRDTILNAPFTWPWNRNEYAINAPNTPASLTSGIQDYTLPITDFAYLEKISLLSADGTYGFEIKDCYNTNILGLAATGASAQAEPNGAAVRSYIPGTSVSLRFLSNPDQAYTGIVTYQVMSLPFQVFTVTAAGNASAGNTTYTGTFSAASFTVGQPAAIAGFVTNVVNNGTFNVVSVNATTLVLANPSGVAESVAATAVNVSWFPIPESYKDIYNNLFLAEVFEIADDPPSGAYYRQRGIAALLSKSEGLTELQRNAFLAQYLVRGMNLTLGAQMRTQQGNQARGV